jgi:UDP-GlcNAc3NAcA epimerase
MDRLVLTLFIQGLVKLITNMSSEFENVILINPVSYILIIYIKANAYMVVIVSLVFKKEAYFLKIPYTTLRDRTEWVKP